MKHKFAWRFILSIACILPLVACNSTAPEPSQTILPATDTTVPTTAPTPTLTENPTPSTTAAPTDTATPKCAMTSPDDAYVLQPKVSGEAGWCDLEYSDFTITYPDKWVIEAGGAWDQNRRFYIQMTSSKPPSIMFQAQTTFQPLDNVDQTIMMWYDGDMVIPDPVMGPNETDEEKHIQSFGGTEVLVTTSKQADKTIRRYFWLSPQLIGKNKRMFVFFEIEGLKADFGSPEYTQFLGTMEEVIAKVHLTPTCADGFTHLHADIYARVTPGTLPNRVRSEPSKKGEIIAQLYPGTIVSVGNGPVCADGLVFWRVWNKNIPGDWGWMAEGDFSEYYMEPYFP